MSYIDVDCPLCHNKNTIPMRLVPEGSDDGTASLAVQDGKHTCACIQDDLMSGPFDETVELVTEWERNCSPYAIQGERATP